MNPRPTDPEFVAIDLETTGLDPRADRMVELAAIRFDAAGRTIATFDTRIDPGLSVPAAASAIHGLSDRDLAGAPRAGEVLPRFFEFLGEPESRLALAHNACIDAAFLGAECRRAGHVLPPHWIADTLALARSKHPELRRHNLDFLADRFGMEPRATHRAAADALCVKQLWLRLGGDVAPAGSLFAYPIHDPAEGVPTPQGWEVVRRAVDLGRGLRIAYEGGSRGPTPRAITPRRFLMRGGEPYLLAFCHLARKDREFRLDRIRECVPCDEVPSLPTDRRVDCP